MNTILLEPTDVLFFRDGRPMEGSLAGHGAGWPLPNVISAAFHAALHRSGLGDQAHAHRRGARGQYADNSPRDRKFGSLATAGPFPVRLTAEKDPGEWFFPRPQDLQDDTLQPGLLPTSRFDAKLSNLPGPLLHAVANLHAPQKENKAKAWLSKAAFEQYLTGQGELAAGAACDDWDFSDVEHNIGIAIDPETGTTGQGAAEGKIYSAHFLRLRRDWRLGVCAAAVDKDYSAHNRDLVRALLNGDGRQIIVGGQQRVCTATRIETPNLPLPLGLSSGFNPHAGQFLLKWVLLSPAIWPEITADPDRNIKAHPGGWLPNWIEPQTGAVLLTSGPGVRKAQRKHQDPGQPIPARLVAALVPKPLVVTGWALPNETDRPEGGAKSTHLAVPPGAVYYFQAASEDAARALAAALNWHGASNGAEIKNRRSTLLGEKGFGLGVCGTWHFYEEVRKS